MKLYERITAENWHKGSMFGPQPGQACLMGHMIWGIPECVSTDTCERVRNAIGVLYPERGGATGKSMAGFNDHPDTTFEDVQRVLKFADV